MAAIVSPASSPQPRSGNSFFSAVRRRLWFPQRLTSNVSTQQSTASSSTAGACSTPPNLYANAHCVPFVKGPVFVYPDAYTEISQAHKQRWEAVVHLLKLNVQESDAMREHKDSIAYDLQMCGLQPSKAFPHIVVHCSSKLVPHLHKLFLRPHVKRHYQVKCATNDAMSLPRFGIVFYGVEDTKISGVTYEVSITTQGVSPLVDAGLTMCGSKVISKKNPSRYSTIGAVLRVGQSFYGLTAGHTFVDEPVIDDIPLILSYEDSDAEDDDYSYDFSGMVAGDVNDPNATTSGDKALDSSNGKLLNHLPSTIQDGTRETASSWKSSIFTASKSSRVFVPAQATPELESNLDWAIVELQDSAHWRPNIYTNESGNLKLVSISHEFVTNLPSESREVSIISSRDGAIRGRLRSLPTIRGGSANQVNESWVVSVQGKDTLGRGDSGSIVVDAQDKKVYGHVVSINPYGNLNVVPMKDTIKQIEIAMGGSTVSLHSFSDTDLSQLLYSSIIDTERLMREWSLCANTLRAHQWNIAADSAAAISKKHRTSSLVQGLQKYLISTNTVNTAQLGSSPYPPTSSSIWTYGSTSNRHATPRDSSADTESKNCHICSCRHRKGEYNYPFPFVLDKRVDWTPLAQGSFSTVYSVDLHGNFCKRCSCTSRHEFALKTINVDNPERLESFSTESEAFTWTQKLSHDNIVKYLGTYQFGDKTFGFLFPLAATDLKTHMSSPRPKSISAVVHILEQLLGLANALHYLHTGFVNEDRSYRNILHMDIKPSNILVFKDRADSDKYTLQLADFGLSRVNERAQSVSTQITVLTEHASHGQDSKPRAKANDRLFRFLSTQTSKVQGSTQSAKVQGDRAYTAPEVELKNQKSSASDIWSFGCVLLECITWLCAGSEALERFKETIAREDTENSLGLWVQDGSAEVTLKPTVKRLVDILSESADHEPSLEPLASLFRPGGVLDLMPERRMDAAGIEVQLRSFLDHKDLEKGIDSLMNGLPSSEAWARLFSTTNTPNLESDQPRLEPQVTAGPIAEDRTPDRLESIPEKVQASLKTRTTAPAAVQEPPPEAQGIATEEQSLRGSRESFERHNGRHNLLRSDAGEKCRSAWNSITQRDKALLLPQQNSAPSQVSNRSCPPQSTPRLDARRISKLPRRMTPEDVRNAVTRLKSQNTSPQTVKMRSGGAVSLRSAETRLNPLMDAY